MSRRDKEWRAALIGAFLLIVLAAVLFAYTVPAVLGVA